MQKLSYNYVPINTLVKIYEKIVEIRLKNKTTKDQIKKIKSGFRKSRSRQDHMFTIKQLNEQKKNTIYI